MLGQLIISTNANQSRYDGVNPDAFFSGSGTSRREVIINLSYVLGPKWILPLQNFTFILFCAVALANLSTVIRLLTKQKFKAKCNKIYFSHCRYAHSLFA